MEEVERNDTKLTMPFFVIFGPLRVVKVLS